MNSRKDREVETQYRRGYVEGQASGNNNTILGVIAGIAIVVLLGLGAWYFLGRTETPETEQPNIINVPAPEAPEAPPTVNVTPDVNINVPAPDVSVPAPTNGSTDSGASTGTSEQGQ